MRKVHVIFDNVTISYIHLLISVILRLSPDKPPPELSKVFSLYPPQNEVLGGYTVFSLSVIPSFRHSVILSFRQHFEIFAE